MKNPVIEFKNFSFQYDAQSDPTLKNINLTIYEGEKILLIGASGSGKSTLGKCLNGLIPQNDKGHFEGNLKIGSRTFGEASIYDLSLEVGTVLQDTDSQFVGLTVGEDIAFSLENEQTAQTTMQQKVRLLAKKLGLSDYLTQKPQDLSGGQKQRVSMAGVLIDETPILLFDEPLANLDPQTGYEAIQIIDQLYQEKKFTTLIIEHRLEEVLTAPIDRVLLMNDGQIVADLSPTELLKTNLLNKYGIREPLYLSALKRADIPLENFPNLTKPSGLVSPEIAKNLQNFQNQFPSTPKRYSQEALLTAQKLNFSYQIGDPILKDLDFSIQRGEIVSLVGHNGAGKSTLSHVITGFHAPSSGRLLWQTRDFGNDSIKERAEKIGYVLQNSNQMLSKNLLFDEVALGLQNREVPEEVIKEKVNETLKICGLHEFRSWPLSALSYGQKRRAAIAAILVLDPELIILDEPTAGQDYRHYKAMMDFIVHLNQQGLTILMVTHDMHLMLEYTQRTIVLKDGEIFAEGTPAQILSSKKIVEEASLRETSLYTLAKNNDLLDPIGFVASFIASERKDTSGK